jgi:hypothetical protein
MTSNTNYTLQRINFPIKILLQIDDMQYKSYHRWMTCTPGSGDGRRRSPSSRALIYTNGMPDL